MANLTYRQSATAPVPGATTVKNAPLTNSEMDGNLKSLADDLTTKSTVTQLNTGIQSAIDSALALSIALG